jgi:hypothetical protein
MYVFDQTWYIIRKEMHLLVYKQKCQIQEVQLQKLHYQEVHCGESCNCPDSQCKEQTV